MRAAGLLVALGLAWGLAVSPARADLQRPLAADRVPDGSRVTIAAGAPLLHVVFLASWCQPCLAEVERLGELEERWSERGYRLVLVGVANRQTADRLADLLERRSLPGEVVFDTDGSLQKALGGDLLPTHLLFDASGRELLRDGALSGAVEKAIDERMTELDRRPGRTR